MIRWTTRLVIAATLLAAAPGLAQTPAGQAPATPPPVWPARGTFTTGDAIALDGYTIEIAGQEIGLFGIDAPEMSGDARGPVARGALDDILALNRTVTCEALDMDRHKRPMARCRAGGRDIAEAMVLGGWGFSFRKFSTDYDWAEAEARAEGRGFWTEQDGGNSWWNILERWQTAISALIGFMGLWVITHKGFEHTIRARQHSAELDHKRDEAQRLKETEDLAAALGAEIDGIIVRGPANYVEALIELKESLNRVPEEWAPRYYVGARVEPQVFPKIVDKIGLLPGNSPELLARFYNQAAIMNESFDLLQGEAFALQPADKRKKLVQGIVDLAKSMVKEGFELSEKLGDVAGRPPLS